MAGCIAGCSLVSSYLEQEKGYELAERIILGITEKMIKEDSVLDVLGGISGLVLALTKDSRWLDHPNTKDHVSDILKWCGAHLLDRKRKKRIRALRSGDQRKPHSR
jgi:lantibiotic modifying enzyme